MTGGTLSSQPNGVSFSEDSGPGQTVFNDAANDTRTGNASSD
jgi:hypothetical protein